MRDIIEIERDFFDDFTGAGVIPTVLVRWEMTGLVDPILQNPVVGFPR